MADTAWRGRCLATPGHVMWVLALNGARQGRAAVGLSGAVAGQFFGITCKLRQIPNVPPRRDVCAFYTGFTRKQTGTQQQGNSLRMQHRTAG
jgi:hypothetical protein